MNRAPYTLSPDDRARVEEIEQLARSGEGANGLVARLDDPSWVVRRAVVAALASLGEAAVAPLLETLTSRRDKESRIAAAVDALSASRAAVEDRVVQLGRSPSPAIVCDALQILGRRRCRTAVGFIADLARHDDDNVAVSAIEALGRIGGVETVAALIGAVEQRHFFRTFPAIDALGRTGDPRAVAPLEALLGDPLYAAEAARALGRTGQEGAVAPLGRLLVDRSDVLVRTAVVALAELRERYEARFGDNEALAKALPRAVPPHDATERILGALGAASATEHVAAARVLGWLGDDLAIARLVEMTMAEPPVDGAAADALRRLGPAATGALLAAIREGDSARRLRLLPIVGYAAASFDDLVLCLGDPDAEVRARACDALARLGNTAAVTALFKLLGDRDGRVSHAASAAIQSLGSQESKRLALEQARSEEPRTRRAAIRIIAYFGYPEGLDVLVSAIDDEDEKIREAAIYGLPLIDDPKAVSALLAHATHASARVRAAVARALGQTSRAPEVERVLEAALGDADPWVRYYACQSLGRLAIESAVARLVERLDDESGQVRVAAVEALAHLEDARAAAALARAARSADPDIRRAALVGLGIGRRPDSIPTLREAASAPDPATRLVAIGALSEQEGAEVVPTLAHAASDPDEGVRNAAIGYLSTRPGADATHALLAQLGRPEVRERVLDALAVAADERVEAVLTMLEGASADDAPNLVAALSRMRRPSSQAALGAALTMTNVHARRASAAALAALGTTEAREALVRSGMADPDADVRRIAAAAARPA